MAHTDLFDGFSPTSPEEWKAKIEKDLRGKEFESLLSQTQDGITIQPFYHRSQTDVSGQPFKAMAKWDIVQEILVEDAKDANKEALDHLNRGASSLLFYVNADVNVEQLLEGIQIEFIRTNFVVEGDALALAENFKKLITDRGLNASEIAGSINIDCLESIARTGNWKVDEASDFENIKKLNASLPENIKGLCINANLFANAGATLSQQLGIALSMVYEYIHRLELKNTNSFWINFALGSDYFGEIAKLRAFRRLWAQLNNELGFEQNEAFIYAETALRNKTILDGYNNMIRTTSESMAAAISGANEISVKGFSHTFKNPDFFGERIAKNQQNMLEHESHMNAVNDISQGSYFIETLTEELATKGWDFFKEIEKRGGYVDAMKSGWLQELVELSAATEQKAFDDQKVVLIGANKYAKQDENLKEIIEHGMFAGSNKDTVIKRIVPTRLSEKLEA